MKMTLVLFQLVELLFYLFILVIIRPFIDIRAFILDSLDYLYLLGLFIFIKDIILELGFFLV
jgi:hypothetical protein